MQEMQYLNFDVRIERVGNGYRVEVEADPNGEASVDFELPFSHEELRSFEWFPNRVLRHLQLVATNQPITDPLDPKAFGTRLFEAVFVGNARDLLQSTFVGAEQQPGLEVRIRLRLRHVPELAELPWEYLYLPSRQSFAALWRRTSVVRYTELPRQDSSVQVKLPLRILAIISNPKNTLALDVEKEWKQLQEAIDESDTPHLIQLTRLPQATREALRERLRTDEVHVLHFIGHGHFSEEAAQGKLIFEHGNHDVDEVTADDLATILNTTRSLRLVFLNACEGARSSAEDTFTGVAQQLVLLGIPAVLAMQFKIGDRAAQKLAGEFYDTLAKGYPIDMAVTQARVATKTDGTEDAIEWATPALYMRSSDGYLFRLPKPVPNWISRIGVALGAAAIVLALGLVIVHQSGLFLVPMDSRLTVVAGFAVVAALSTATTGGDVLRRYGVAKRYGKRVLVWIRAASFVIVLSLVLMVGRSLYAKSLPEQVRSHGWDVAADNLEHFLAGSGEDISLPATWLREFRCVRWAEFANHTSFRAAEHSSQGNLDVISSEMLTDQTFSVRFFRDTWLAHIETEPDEELYYARGYGLAGEATTRNRTYPAQSSLVRSTGNFTFTRQGDIISILGTVEHSWIHTYVEPRELIQWYTGNRNAIVPTQYQGQPFRLVTIWTTTLIGKRTMIDGQLGRLEYQWYFADREIPNSQNEDRCKPVPPQFTNS